MPFMTPKEYAKKIGVSTRSVLELIEEGLPVVETAGGDPLIEPDAANDWLTERDEDEADESEGDESEDGEAEEEEETEDDESEDDSDDCKR